MENSTDNAANGLIDDYLDFWDRVFHDLLPVAIKAEGWKAGDVPITSGEARVSLAATWADFALLERSRRIALAAPKTDGNDLLADDHRE